MEYIDRRHRLRSKATLVGNTSSRTRDNDHWLHDKKKKMIQSEVSCSAVESVGDGVKSTTVESGMYKMLSSTSFLSLSRARRLAAVVAMPKLVFQIVL